MKIKPPVNAKTYREIVSDMIDKEKASIVVEVGVYAGDLSRKILENDCVEILYLVDWWTPYAYITQEMMSGAEQRVQSLADKDERIKIIKGRSDDPDILGFFSSESVDFIHQDGAHDTENLCRDIELWWPKLKTGCVFSGDNYEALSVKNGVDRMFPDCELAGKGRIWWVRK